MRLNAGLKTVIAVAPAPTARLSVPAATLGGILDLDHELVMGVQRVRASMWCSTVAPVEVRVGLRRLRAGRATASSAQTSASP
jgi:hypothetical protein